MRGNYYINITLHFLYFQITITVITGIVPYCTSIIINICINTALCTPYYILCCCENEFNSIKLMYIFGLILVNYYLSKSATPKQYWKSTTRYNNNWT